MLDRIGKALSWFEDALLTVLTLSILIAGGVQIIARYGFEHSWVWIEPAQRAAVLWIALIGALVAAREGRHINVDAITRVLGATGLRVVRAIAYGFAAVIAMMFARGSWELVKLDRESSTMAFAEVPAWWVELVLPFGFALLAIRFLVHALARMPQEPVPGSLT